MVSVLTSALRQISLSNEEFGRLELLRRLKPGVRPDITRGELSKLDLPFPGDELSSLYEWHNGTDSEGVKLGRIYLFPGFYMLSLEEGLEIYNNFVGNERWGREWFPLFADGGGDFYVVTCSRMSSRNGKIVHFMIDEPDHSIEYESLAPMLQTMAEAYRRKIFFVDQEGYLDEDPDAFLSLGEELNQDVPWWTDPIE
ncbi:SMI1/KNR4 family protein [Paenarthrobacter sp. DKR-5]|uniref:SMI1/KNR4 family protein n=1 Tax=Paenarthrobacter sp. DKR-5 TaxID=2835535 RepID=UPI001BDBBFB3|nr:SMI1/KNR4 family protein [Paenarthrobacter sp. DKR-5]MBT1001631.1 SMI1/KNR4 family protein [Paenarthrobacter sp. DKR-5]